MQILSINYLHHASKFCAGYDRYLEKRKMGSIGVFNWHFFFFNFFWFSYHRMYKELSLILYFYIFILILSGKGALTPLSASLIISIFYFINCFYSYYFYELAFNTKIKPNENDPYKKIKPFNIIISTLIFFIVITLNIKIYSIFLTKFL